MSTAQSAHQPIEVLLVEDSPSDVRLMKETFLDANSLIRLHVAADGIEAMALLRQWTTRADCPRPDLILLDLNLPKLGGLEVLAQIKDDAELKSIPTVILTVSDAEIEIADSYGLKANCYLCKPVGLKAFENLIRNINDFWLTRVTLPPHGQVA